MKHSKPHQNDILILIFFRNALKTRFRWTFIYIKELLTCYSKGRVAGQRDAQQEVVLDVAQYGSSLHVTVVGGGLQQVNGPAILWLISWFSSA